MNQDEAVSAIRKDLKALVEPEYKKGLYRYFKEEINPLGVRSGNARKVAVKYFDLLSNEWEFNDFVKLSERLLKKGYFEECGIAIDLMEMSNTQFTEKTFYMFEDWLNKYVKNWAHCDTLCNHSVGILVERYTRLIGELKKWTGSKNRWVRRASTVSLILPARKGLFLKEVFEVSEKLMTDNDDMVQKGVGWLLKEASKKHEKEVVKFLLKWKDKTSRVVLRYATEKVSKSNRIMVLS